MSSVVDVKRKKNERFDSLLRRFNRRVIESGKVLQARKIRYHNRSTSDLKTKAAALRKKTMGEKHEWLRKTGQLPEEKHGRGRR